ncbi:uncharacterized protein LOC116853502 [Odontomachus brunneus]|uniref:uncharacterized protein LOC116853502 n=1 Tax=Odontomachus brunneus TaxID=486640 RepID=UPI0013F251AB|nr:uncharacterized protein LOC116853502 [Odontomachus brunneus]
MRKLVQELGITQRLTPVWTPQCNPVERANRTVKTMIAQYVGENHRQWDANLHEIKFAFNTAKQDTTGFSPAYLNTGRELPGPHIREREHRESQVPSEIGKRLESAHELVRINLARAFQKQGKYYNLRKRKGKPKIGDVVWKRNHALSSKEKAINAKLAPKFLGPMTVRRIISPVIVDLQDKNKKWYKQVHIQDLKTENDLDDVTADKEGVNENQE